MNPNGAIIVQSNLEIMVEVDNPNYETARDAIAPFTELVKSPEHLHTYRNRGHIHHLKPAGTGPIYIMSGPIGNQQYTVPADKTFDKSAIYQPTPENYLLRSASTEKLTVTCYTAAGERIETTELNKH